MNSGDLHSIGVFSGLSADELARVAAAARPVHFEPGHVIVNEGEFSFSFYAIITLPFMILALTMTMGLLLGTARTGLRRTAGVVVSGAFLVLTVLNFAWFWPIWTDQLLTHREWLDRIWFTRWI